jgi:hypothetical protein
LGIVTTFAMTIYLAKGWKAGVLSDVHVEPNYQQNITADTKCILNEKKVVYTDQFAPYGRLGCDIPVGTLELVLKRMSEKEKKLDVLFMPGDFIGHTIPID